MRTRRPQPIYKTNPLITGTWFLLIGLLALMTWLAWRNSQPLQCDNYIFDNGMRICVVIM